MTRRSALIAGLVVLAVLLGGQVVGTWRQRPPTDVATVGNETPSGSNRRTPAPTARPTPAGQPAGRPAPTPTGKQAGPGVAAFGVKKATGSAAVALTFDDGPHPVYTPQILAVLRANGVRAVFCLVGSEVRRYPQLVARIVREGHTLCNHSWRHELNLGSWPAPKIRDNLLRTNAEIRRAVPGAKIPYFRQPGGKWTRVGARVTRELGMESLGWSVDPRDWEKPPAKTIKSRVLAATKPGAVVLLHDAGGNRTATVAACRALIPILNDRFRLTLLR